jgi:hypothetical protein
MLLITIIEKVSIYMDIYLLLEVHKIAVVYSAS